MGKKKFQFKFIKDVCITSKMCYIFKTNFCLYLLKKSSVFRLYTVIIIYVFKRKDTKVIEYALHVNIKRVSYSIDTFESDTTKTSLSCPQKVLEQKSAAG